MPPKQFWHLCSDKSHSFYLESVMQPKNWALLRSNWTIIFLSRSLLIINLRGLEWTGHRGVCECLGKKEKGTWKSPVKHTDATSLHSQKMDRKNKKGEMTSGQAHRTLHCSAVSKTEMGDRVYKWKMARSYIKIDLCSSLLRKPPIIYNNQSRKPTGSKTELAGSQTAISSNNSESQTMTYITIGS